MLVSFCLFSGASFREGTPPRNIDTKIDGPAGKCIDFRLQRWHHFGYRFVKFQGSRYITIESTKNYTKSMNGKLVKTGVGTV